MAGEGALSPAGPDRLMGRGPRRLGEPGVGSHREAIREPAGLTGNVATARHSLSSCGPAALAPGARMPVHVLKGRRRPGRAVRRRPFD